MAKKQNTYLGWLCKFFLIFLLFPVINVYGNEYNFEAGKETSILSKNIPETNWRFFSYTPFHRGYSIFLGDYTRNSIGKNYYIGIDSVTKYKKRFQFNAGLLVLEKPTERLGTTFQFHFAAYLFTQINSIKYTLSVHHFSNGNFILNTGGPNLGEDFLLIGIRVNL